MYIINFSQILRVVVSLMTNISSPLVLRSEVCMYTLKLAVKYYFLVDIYMYIPSYSQSLWGSMPLTIQRKPAFDFEV